MTNDVTQSMFTDPEVRQHASRLLTRAHRDPDFRFELIWNTKEALSQIPDQYSEALKAISFYDDVSKFTQRTNSDSSKPSIYLDPPLWHNPYDRAKLQVMIDKRNGSDEASSIQLLSSLPIDFRLELLSMYSDKAQIAADGKQYWINRAVRISPEMGMWLYRHCADAKPKATLEIGLAYGYSMLYFLAAHSENGFGVHIAIDPYQDVQWHGIGKQHAKSTRASKYFRLIQMKSVPALVQLACEQQKFEFIFVDGNHRFDDVLVDFTLSADLCALGGFIAFDDMWLPAIRMAVGFIRSNRQDFEEIQTPVRNLAVFKRIGDDNRAWDNFVKF